MRVLYVNHTSVMSGAEQSLLVLLRSLDSSVSPMVACPEGPLAGAVREIGVPVHPIEGTSLSARLHPVHTVREAGSVLSSAVSVSRLAQRRGADVIHANTPRAGLMCCFARGASGARPVVHVRDSVPPGRTGAAMFTWMSKRTSAFIPTSSYLAEQLPAGPMLRPVANAVEPGRFDPANVDREAVRARLDLAPGQPALGVIAQISPHKGQRDAIEILERVRRTHSNARLLLIGSVKFADAATRFDNRAYEQELLDLTHGLGLDDEVLFLGERDDVPELLRALDVLLIPSWYEPFGRTALEAMMMEVPVLATTVGGTREVVRDGVDGLLLPPKQPAEWARSVDALLLEPARRAAMGSTGRRRALAEFGPDAHRGAIVETYEDVLATCVRRGRER